MALLLFVTGWLHLATLLVTVLFSSFALNLLAVSGRKWLAVLLFSILLLTTCTGFYLFIKRAYFELPRMAETTIPVVLGWAEKQNIELPFTDYASLRHVALNAVKEELAGIGKYAKTAVYQVVALVIGVVVAISLFFNSRMDLERISAPNNLYTLTVNELGQRFATFYRSFATVMGAQIVISGINTALTAIFLLWNSYPYAQVIIGVTFLCGLLPIVGNLLSNTLIVGVGFTISPKMALAALIFLIVLHKLEYFLNSKIIGDRIRNPMWLTLLGLVVGEKVMGIPGMILAPVILHSIKIEAKRSRVTADRIETEPGTTPT